MSTPSWSHRTSCPALSILICLNPHLADPRFSSRCQISTHFAPGDFQGFALVNPQRNSQLTGGFTVESVPGGPQLSFGNFAHLGQESFYWQLPDTYQGDKVRSKWGLQPLPSASSKPGPC